jgi:hypothetical protein
MNEEQRFGAINLQQTAKKAAIESKKNQFHTGKSIRRKSRFADVWRSD